MKNLLFLAMISACTLVHSAETFRDCVVIPKAGGDTGGGENLDCGQGSPFLQSLIQGTVKCGDVQLRIPAGYLILEVKVEWPNGGDWAAVRLGPTRVPQSDGATIVSVGGKNWAGDLSRQMCLSVDAVSTTPGRTR